MVPWLINDKLESMWNVANMTSSIFYSVICLQRMRSATKYFGQNNRYRFRASNRPPPEYKSRALQFTSRHFMPSSRLILLMESVKERKINKYQLHLMDIKEEVSRTRWPRGLRHEPSSLARSLRSWVRIPLEEWISVYAFMLCLCYSVATGWSPVQGVIPTVYRLRNWKSGHGPTKGCRTIIE
jgi:hypothetical protein